MEVRQVGWMHELQNWPLGGDEEDAAVPAGMRPHRLKDRLQSVVERRNEEVFSLFQVAKAVDDQRPTGAQYAPDGTSRPKHLLRLVAQAASHARVESHSGHSQ